MPQIFPMNWMMMSYLYLFFYSMPMMFKFCNKNSNKSNKLIILTKNWTW